MPYTNALDEVLPESGASTRWIGGSNPGVNVTGTAANETLTGGGNQVLTGGLGDDTYGLTGSATVVELPNGGIDVLSVWNSATLPANVENLKMNGGYGWYGFGNSQDNIILGTGGSQQIDGRAGNDVLVGGAGADLFVISRGQGSDVIFDFASGSDRIKLDGYGLHSIADVRSVSTQVGADTFLSLAGGEKLILRGVTATSLVAKDFLYDIDLSKFTQTFGDDFNSLSFAVNGGTWRTWYGSNASTDLKSRYHNDEAQVYTDPGFRGTSGAPLGLNPFSIHDGVLAISATPLTSAQSSALGGHTYSSGLITTQTTFSQLYGYFEIRAALPEGQGMWPAFWLLPANGNWPPEIDVFEMLGKDPDTIYLTTHQTVDGKHVQEEIRYRLDTSEFHTYGVEWAADVITYYVDGSAIGTIPTPPTMHAPMYMLANLAVGGAWAGAPDATTGAREMLIDYIHAYARTPAPADNVINGTASANVLIGGGWNDAINALGGNDTLDGGGGSDTLNGGDGIDTAVYAGVRRQYGAASSSTVVGGPEGGADTLTSIENARFVDGTLTFDVNSALAQVMRLYDAALDRAPDQGGLQGQASALASGAVSLSALALGFVNSPEFHARYGSLSNQAFVEQLYRFALDRQGDLQGIQGWVANLNTGMSRGDVVVAFSESAEHRGQTASTLAAGLWAPDDQAVVIARLYDATFDRLPDVGGLAGWVTNFKGGMPLSDIAAAFASSAEFQTRYGALSNQTFVEQLYRFTLDRNGDPGGVQNWVSNLNNGMTRADVLKYFSESAEHVSLTDPLWLGGVRYQGYQSAVGERLEVGGSSETLTLVAESDTTWPEAGGTPAETLHVDDSLSGDSDIRGLLTFSDDTFVLGIELDPSIVDTHASDMPDFGPLAPPMPLYETQATAPQSAPIAYDGHSALTMSSDGLFRDPFDTSTPWTAGHATTGWLH